MDCLWYNGFDARQLVVAGAASFPTLYLRVAFPEAARRVNFKEKECLSN